MELSFFIGQVSREVSREVSRIVGYAGDGWFPSRLSLGKSIRSKLIAALRPFYQERDRLRLLVQFRKAFIDRLLAEGEESAEATAGDYQSDAAEKDREYDSTASALEGKRELNAEETARLKQLWKKLVRMFHPDLHGQDPEKRKTYELLTQAINGAKDRGTSNCWNSSPKTRRRSSGSRAGPAFPSTRSTG